MSEIKLYKRKVVLLGDGGVGKTSLIRRFVINKFDDKYLCTIGTKVTEKNIFVKTEHEIGMGIKLLIWDFMGQKGYRNIEKSGLKGTTGAILVYDVTRLNTFNSISDYWLPLLNDVAPDVPIVFLANKIDLLPENKKSSIEATTIDDFQNLLNRYKAPGYFTSALNGKNVESGFIGLGKLLLREINEPTRVQLPQRIIPGLKSEYHSPIIKATDEIIMDFHKSFGGDIEETMPIIRKQFEKAGVDINEPTIESLRKVIEYLGRVESNFWSNDVVNNRRQKRLSIINQITEISSPNEL